MGVDTTRPDGNGSVKVTLESDPLAFGFLSVMVSEVVPFSGTVSAPKLFVIVGGDRLGGSIFRGALAVLPVPPLVDVTALVTFTMLPTPDDP